MRSLGRICIGIVCSIGVIFGASVEATVDTKEVIKGNPVKLHIKAIGGSAAFPNIDEVAGYRVINTSTSTQYSVSMVNGSTNTQRSTTKTITFLPQNDMIIPPYSVKIGGIRYSTKPIKIKVLKSQAPQVNGNAQYSFVLKSDKKVVSVGESFIVTLYLNIANNLGVQQVTDYVEPSSQDFFLKDLGKQKQYKRGNFTIIEKRYNATAKKEGNGTISAASAKIGIADRNRQDLFGRYSIRWAEVMSNSLNMQVVAQNQDSDLVGDFKIENRLDKHRVKANKPVNLTIKIEGKGNLEDFQFPKYEIDGVTIYSDDAKVESHLVNNELISKYTKSFVFISEEDFTIPKRTISVYDLNTKKVKMLEVPAYSVTIEKDKKNITASVNNTLNTTPVKTLPDINSSEVEAETKSSIAWWMLIVAFMLGSVVMYVLKFIPNFMHKQQKFYKESEALNILYAHISEDAKVEEMVRKLYAKKNGDKSIKIDKKELKEMIERFR